MNSRTILRLTLASLLLCPAGRGAALSLVGAVGATQVQPALILTVSPQAATAAVFSPDGKVLVTGGGDGFIQFWSAATGTRLARLNQGSPVTALAYSPDGTRLASAGRDTRVRVWNTQTNIHAATPLQTLETGTYAVNGLAFSPDGQLLAGATGDNSRQAGTGNSVKLWDRAGELVGSLVGHTDGVTSVAFAPGHVLVSGSLDGTVRLWNWRERLPERTLTGHADGVTSVAVSADGRWIASGSLDATARLWQLSGRPGAVLRAHAGPVRSVAFTPDGRQLASGSDDQQIRLWRVPDGQPLSVLSGHSGFVSSLAFGQGRLVSAGLQDHTVRLWTNP